MQNLKSEEVFRDYLIYRIRKDINTIIIGIEKETSSLIIELNRSRNKTKNNRKRIAFLAEDYTKFTRILDKLSILSTKKLSELYNIIIVTNEKYLTKVEKSQKKINENIVKPINDLDEKEKQTKKNEFVKVDSIIHRIKKIKKALSSSKVEILDSRIMENEILYLAYMGNYIINKKTNKNNVYIDTINDLYKEIHSRQLTVTSLNKERKKEAVNSNKRKIKELEIKLNNELDIVRIYYKAYSILSSEILDNEKRINNHNFNSSKTPLYFYKTQVSYLLKQMLKKGNDKDNEENITRLNKVKDNYENKINEILL